MNNEEKILSILEQLAVDVTSMKSDISELKAGQKTIESAVAKLEASQWKIRKDINEMKFEIKEGLWSEVVRIDKRIDALEEHIGI